MNNPGSKEARDSGCTCPVLDNGYGLGCGYRDEKGTMLFYINTDCPVHGNNAA